jgi:excisionase family DNA binding protein
MTTAPDQSTIRQLSRWLTPDEAAAYLRVSRGSLVNLVRAGTIPAPKALSKRILRYDRTLLRNAKAKVEYATPDFTAEDPSDLLRFKGEAGTSVLWRLLITAKLEEGGFVIVDLGGDRGRSREVGAYGHSFDDTATIGLAIKVHDFLKGRRRAFPVRIFSSARRIIITLLVLCLVGLFVSSLVPHSPVLQQVYPTLLQQPLPLPIATIGWAAAMALGFIYANFGDRVFGSRVYLYPQSEHKPAFEWADYKGWIGGVIGTVGAVLAIFFLQRWTGWTLN